MVKAITKRMEHSRQRLGIGVPQYLADDVRLAPCQSLGHTGKYLRLSGLRIHLYEIDRPQAMLLSQRVDAPHANAQSLDTRCGGHELLRETRAAGNDARDVKEISFAVDRSGRQLQCDDVLKIVQPNVANESVED